ncbi:MAG: amino acid/amide transporter rane protein 2, family / amino acid/amide transporter [Frankiales bacterium]|nr:amino acid/amide transporter rane protein 2, family / amino acid/amide transporter [Frankiales bacterium]
MTQFLAFTIIGIVAGATYAIAASGLVLTYATSNVFNMAHGSVGMFMAFLYWEVQVNQGWPTWLALLFVLGLAAPAMGLLLERVMMRRLTEAPVAISIVVTVGLLVALIGLAQTVWKPAGRDIPEFFVGQAVDIGPVRVTIHQLITLGTALALAGGLYVLLNRTRIGTAMRAVVDNRELLALHGGRPNLLSGLSWAMGCSLAALAGILIAPQISLDYITLTLLVISAYAAAMVGRLKNLPRTFVGALVLGLLTTYAQWGVSKIDKSTLDASQGLIQGARIALPTLFLLAVMLVLPQEKLRVGRIGGTTLPPLPSWRKTLAWSGVFLAVVYTFTANISPANNSRFGQALCLSLIMLSLVLLTGYGGDVSLCQLSFVGVGALVTGRLVHGITPVTIVVAFLVSGAVGVLIAVPALRLRGLYLGLGTLAVASAMDTLVFETSFFGFGARGASFDITRPSWLRSEQSFVMAVAVAFVVMSMVVLAIRRGKYGRILLATRDSQAACATLGFSTTAVRVAVFGVSAGLAGVAGVFYTGMHVSVSTEDFFFFKSLPLLLFAAVAGLTCISGALLGGLFYGVLPFLNDKYPSVATLVAGPGLLAGILLLGGNPNGFVGILFGLRSKLPAELVPAFARRSRAKAGVVVGSA